jgi:hypothetical protein
MITWTIWRVENIGATYVDFLVTIMMDFDLTHLSQEIPVFALLYIVMSFFCYFYSQVIFIVI